MIGTQLITWCIKYMFPTPRIALFVRSSLGPLQIWLHLTCFMYVVFGMIFGMMYLVSVMALLLYGAVYSVFGMVYFSIGEVFGILDGIFYIWTGDLDLWCGCIWYLGVDIY